MQQPGRGDPQFEEEEDFGAEELGVKDYEEEYSDESNEMEA